MTTSPMERPTKRGLKMAAPGKGNKIKKLIVNSVSRKYFFTNIFIPLMKERYFSITYM